MKTLRALLRVGLFVSIATAVLFTIALLGRLALRDWQLFLLTFYFIGMAIALVIIALVAAILMASRDLGYVGVTEQVFRTLFVYRYFQQGLLDKIRIWLTLLCGIGSILLTWPGHAMGYALRGLRYRGRLTTPFIAGLDTLFAEDLFWGLIFASTAAATTILSVHLSPQGMEAGRIFLYCVVLYCSLLSLDLIVSPRPIAERLRRAAGSPLIRTVLVCLLCVLAFVVAFAGLEDAATAPLEAISKAIAGMRSQLRFTGLLLHGEHLPTLSLLEGLSGALLASTWLRVAISMRALKRTDDDYVAIAVSQLQLGRASSALQSLSLVSNVSARSLKVESVALLEVENTALAIEKYVTAVGIERSGMVSESQAITSLYLFAKLNGVSERPIPALTKHLLGLHPPDLELSQVLLAVPALYPRATDEFAALFESSYITTNPRYPFSAALLPLLRDHSATSLAAVVAMPPQTGVLEVFRLSLQLLARIPGPTSTADDSLAFDQWCSTHMQALSDILGQLSAPGDMSACLGVLGPFLSYEAVRKSERFEAFRHILVQATGRFLNSSSDKALARAMVKLWGGGQLPNAP